MSLRGSSVAVTAIIVTYNSSAVIKDCLSLLQSNPEIEVIVFDNASLDGTVELMKREYKNVKVIEHDRNLGFAGAVNRAAEEASGDAILLLNPDAIISGSTVIAMYKTLHSDDSIGVIAPTLRQPAGHLTVREGGREPNLWRVLCHFSGLSRFSHRIRTFEGAYLLHVHGLNTRDVDWVSGACMMVKSELWSSLGGLSDRWFMYAEDIEFCLRARECGLRVVMSADFDATHALGESSGSQDFGKPNTLWIENLFDLYKWKISGGRLSNIAWKVVVAGGFYARAMLYMGRSRIGHSPDGPDGISARRALTFARAVSKQPSKLDAPFLD
ncbi:glycosyltransferase family 2 protein [Rhodococcus sp. IEGM 1354]|uniref:glycosyltransferase family 2 protein n=1 Tax=Rhodococcus sp. IEGM 1354 TaxID=3047088 RepID=UPI0024B86956|nr:glycosyltransferase family 2 protein [Rhodococcus sp. IEGM 1354]MDI9929500.1 glycosyltransferase family 2 protein [Rhodococcus sp. IEGM 1354]